MFSSGFAESALDADLQDSSPDDASVSDIGAYAQHFDDSDAEDEMFDLDQDCSSEYLERDDGPVDDGYRPPQADLPTTINRPASMSVDDDPEHHHTTRKAVDGDEETRHTRQKLSHPSTPRARELALEQLEVQSETTRSSNTSPVEIVPFGPPEPEVPGPKKTRVVIRDVAYTTYRAVLYYVRAFPCHPSLLALLIFAHSVCAALH